MHAHADRLGVGERCADGAVLWQVAILALRGYAGARVGRVLPRQFAHARPRSGLAAPRCSPCAPDEALLHHLGLPEHQRVDLVGRLSHPWWVFTSSPPPFLLIHSHPLYALLSTLGTFHEPLLFPSDAQETSFRMTDVRRLLGRFAHTCRHATNREIGLLFGCTRDPVRALHDRRATLPPVPRHACLSKSARKTRPLPRMARHSGGCIRRACFLPRPCTTLRLHIQRHIQCHPRRRPPRAVAYVRFARWSPICPLRGNAGQLPSSTCWHSRPDGCIDDGGHCVRVIRLSSVGPCRRCPCV